MVLKTSVIDAFRVIGVSPDTPEERAARAYKRLALEHHPDRNRDDVAAATIRFQEIGAAWEICTRHYQNPHSSEVFATEYDEDIYDNLGEDDMFDYYEFMLYEMFMNAEFRFSRKGVSLGYVICTMLNIKLGFRSQRQSGYGSSFKSFYSHPFQKNSSSGFRSSDYETLNEANQRKEKEKYEQRIREFEAENAEREREEAEAERQKMLLAQQKASAQAEAFAASLARSGDSTGVQNIVLKHSLDINGPEKVPKQQQKKGPSKNYKTLLHVAAAKCDVELVTFLLDKDLSALDKDNLNPFHSAILSGNTPVVQYFLSRRGKSSESCHPSKAVTNGRTPLQMAIASGSASTVELLLKDATVHDVERCWEQPSLPVALKDILETKKGFVPRPLADGAPLSRKAALKAEAARKQAAEKEEKARRIADERARAAENSRRKEERAAKRAEMERVKELERRKLEEEERQKAEEARLQAKLKAEEEERIAAEREAERRRAEEEERERAHHEALQEEARRKAALRAAQEERHRKMLEKEARQRVETERQREIEQAAERKRQAAAELQSRQREAESRRKEAEARKRVAKTHQEEVEQRRTTDVKDSVSRSECDTQVDHDRHRQAKSQTKKKAVVSRRPVMDAEAKRAETLRRLQAQAEEHERLKLERQKATSKSVASPIVASAAGTDPKVEAIMRKRAEQSARDKARHQRMKEEKARRESAKRAEPGIDSFAKQADTTTSSHCQSTYPLTPISTCSSPVLWLAEPYVAAPMTPPMTPEDLQTCTIPEDLFAYVPPHRASSSSSSSRVPSNRGGHGHRGRGWRGRGRGRGGHVGRHLGASEAEQALAEKTFEIERLTAELASLRAGLR